MYALDREQPLVLGNDMKNLRINAKCCRHRASGFSLLEVMMGMAIILVMTKITFMSLQPSLNAQHVTNAYNTTLSALRQARDNAISQRTSYHVQFVHTTTSNTITVSPTLSTFAGALAATTYSLPTDVAFTAVSGIPTAGTAVPDGFGVGTVAIDFGYRPQGTSTGGSADLYFCPDGSAQDATNGAGNCAGNWNSGVVYIARPGELMSSRAITIWGGTGRLRGWRLNSGGVAWQRM